MLNRIKSKQNVTFITKKKIKAHTGKKSYFHQERRTFFFMLLKDHRIERKMCTYFFFRKEKEALRMRSNFDSICNETEASYWIFFSPSAMEI